MFIDPLDAMIMKVFLLNIFIEHDTENNLLNIMTQNCSCI